MKKCTLQEAIELCKKNGGKFTKKSPDQFPWVVILPNGYAVSDDNGRRIELNCEYFNATWIYEPPEQSAFQEWNKQPEGSVQAVCRKEGWNAAIDKVFEILVAVSSRETFVKVKKLKEG